MIFCVVLTLAVSCGKVIGQQDPCSDSVYEHIPFLAKRNPSYVEDSVPICDRYLEKKWYRAGFHSMANFDPPLTRCGTIYPYWMNGTLPENGTMARRIVCQVGFQNKCVQSHTIRVKNCGIFAVYELTPLSSCNSAYCFEPSSTCVEGVPTNLSVSYHGVSWTSHPNETATDRTHIPSVNLICNFTPINEENIFYEVNWYIDNKEAIRNQTLATDERTKALLSASEILQIKGKAGSMIHCVVGAKFRPEDSPCSVKSSPLFFAGIKVMIVDNKTLWKGKICFSVTDPHILTFDKLWYKCMLPGTFILYKNDLYNQEVQEKHFMCKNEATCNCAVAVRSGRDVFTIDICDRQSEIINFPLCDDSVLKVVKKADRLYEVLLPTGTRVDISIVWQNETGWFLDIFIYPSTSDIGNTRGLCGIMDEKRENEFTGRNNVQYSTYITRRPDIFSSTWIAKSEEDLLIENQNVFSRLKSISTTMTRVCKCDNSTGQSKTVCNYGNVIDCKFTVGKRYHCLTHPEAVRRRKRDLKHLQTLDLFNKDSLLENEKSVKQRYKRETTLTSMTFEKAKNLCLTMFEMSEAYITCRSFVTDLNINASLESCISDLQITGITELAKIHLEEILQTCSAFILVNSTFQEENPEVTYEIQTLCPWNCSGNGICNSGNCTCYTGYAGSDCSFDLSAPPTITHISDFGFCDKSKENCDEITVYGKYFLENMNTFCYMTRLMYNVDGASLATESYRISLQERTLFEGFCPLQYSSLRPWVTFFQFNISNDDKSFTKTFNVYTFQSLCQEYQNNSGDIYYTFKDGFCFIDGSCVSDGETNPKNLCDICSVASNRYRWTFNEGLCQIDGVCFARGEVQGTNFCRFCNPSSSNSTWSLRNEFCFIRNRCYFRWEQRQLNSCEICDPDQDQSHWSLNKDCIPTSEVSTDLPTEPVEPIIENTTTLKSTTIAPTTSKEATDPTRVTTYPTSEQKTTTASTSAHVSTTAPASTSTSTPTTPKASTMAPIEVSSALLSETDIIVILCASGIAFVIVIALACVVYRARTLKKDSKTRWTIPNVKNTTKEIPGISLMKYTKK